MIKINSNNINHALEKHSLACKKGIIKKISGFENALKNNGNKTCSDKVALLNQFQVRRLIELIDLLKPIIFWIKYFL